MNDQRLTTDGSSHVALAGFFHETHTFLNGATTWQDFEVYLGNAMLSKQGDASPLGGVLSAAATHQWQLSPLVFATAVPGAIIEREALEMFWEHFLEQLEASPQSEIDALYLILHGAGVAQGVDDVEGELLQRIRRLPAFSSVPIFGVYDLHANFSEAMAANSNCLLAYRENPHADAKEAAVRSADRLQWALQSGNIPRMTLQRVPLLLAPTVTGSATEPMLRLLARARQIEAQHASIWAVNVNAGFAFADTADTSLSFSIVHQGDAAVASRVGSDLASLAMEYSSEAISDEPDLTEVLRRVRDRQERASGGLTVIAEPADNIGGGAPGDGTGLLAGLLDHQIQNAAVCLWDPQTVSQLCPIPLNSEVQLSIGGKGSDLGGPPLDLRCKLISLSAGQFELRDKQSHLASMSGNTFDMGQCAVVQSQGVTILLTTNRTPPMDLGQWYHVGIDPQKLSVIGVKAAVAHRRAYEPIASFMEWVSTPGPCQSRLDTFPYTKLKRPIFPLDPLS
jgi:microcystin degradation protein MlrC